MKFRVLSLAAAVALVAGGAQAAITGGITEGLRDKVDGTNATGIDADPNTPGVQLGTIGTGETFGIYGRIKQSQDVFEAEFTAGADFTIAFDFDGYSTTDTVTDANVGPKVFGSNLSGLMSINSDNSFKSPDADKRVSFTLVDIDTNTLIGTKEYTTNINVVDTPLLGLIFGLQSAGNYRLTVDGELGSTALQNELALYDLNISTVPLPAPALLLLGGLGGLSFIARRRAKADA